MLGTIVNTAAVLAGGLVGLLVQGRLKEKLRNTLNHAMALAVIFVGISGALSSMFQNGADAILFIIALALGALCGEALDIELRLERLGNWLQKKLKQDEGKGNFSQGFVGASLLFCVGTMAVLGSFESGTMGVHNILFAKSVLDGITAIVMASTLGVGVVFSAASVFVYQGALTLLASWVSPYLTADMLREMSVVGGIVIFAIGLNMLKLTKIKVGNFLPALLVPVIYYLVRGWLGM